MKKTTVYSFWFAILFIFGSVFTAWAGFFRPSSLAIDNSQPVAFAGKSKFPVATIPNVQTPPKSVSNTQKTQAGAVPKSVAKTQSVQNTVPKNVQPQVQIQPQPAQIMAPTSTRATKTS